MIKVEIAGLKETQDALRKLLPDRTARAVMTRVLRKHAKPMADRMRQLVPERTGKLKASIAVSKQLSSRQKRMHRPIDSSDVEMFVGAGPRKNAHLVEFGTSHSAAQPFARPAFDQGSSTMITKVCEDMRTEIEKTVARAARKAERAAKR